MQRFAAIDVGSNGIRCLVVEVGENGAPHILESVREPVRLGGRVFHTGSIGDVVGEATLRAFHLFRRLLDSTGVETVRAVATSAMREAGDAEDLIRRIRRETDIPIRLISGAEEAHLIRRAVVSRLDLAKGRTAIVDVGGGSVEVVALRDGDVVRSESFTVGAVRLLQALPGLAGEGEGDAFELLDEYVDAIRSRVRTAMGEESADLYAATGGSIDSLSNIIGEPAPVPPAVGSGVRVVELAKLTELVRDLASHSYRERIEKYGLREDRADVILPAALVYLKMGEVFGVEKVFVPGVGLKDGLVLDMIDDLERAGARESRRRELRSAALGLGRRYAVDEPHAEKVAELALSLYDQLGSLHGLAPGSRTLLEAAALLHDIGIYVSASRHHKHSYYLIAESDLMGLDSRQKSIVANVARYHRRRHPTRKHPPFAALEEEDREIVRRLAAILRVADVLDREHRQLVRGVRAEIGKRRVRLHVDADGDLLLERWAADRKFGLFEEVFGVEVGIEE